MIKKLILTISIILLASVAGTLAMVNFDIVNIGDTVSQEDIDETDFSSQNLDVKVLNKELIGDNFVLSFNYKSLSVDDKGAVKLERNSSQASVDLRVYDDCRSYGSEKSECVDRLKQFILRSVHDEKNSSIRKMEDLKIISNYRDELSIDDFNITDEDLE